MAVDKTSEKTNTSKSKEKAIGTGDFPVNNLPITAFESKEKAGDSDRLLVRLINNSIAGHELLRGNGQFISVLGHSKITISTTKEELVAITDQLASKPWVEVHLVNDDDSE
ncbi:hypothetical protein [Photobacterium carnosum]|uniref:hypothetical protein n=1 Tax=Photobacterium carnosum TaxID=2023717 RepID=UPI001E4F7D39|nr:hypothetical protein [Photobacterium carnosum]MCD9516981.1 hypothetical protein [Photobacterium carnosum]